MNKKFFVSAALALWSITQESIAQASPPDSGQIQRDTSKPTLTPPKKSEIKILPKIKEAKEDDTSSEETKVLLKSIRFTGNTVISSETLLALIGDSLGKKHSLKGMQKMALQVSEFYHNEGFFFSRAIIPQQSFNDGTLTIAVEEGCYDSIKVNGTAPIIQGTTGFLAELHKGDVIDVHKMEAALLNLEDIPGLKISPTITEGGTAGTANLIVGARMETLTGGEVSVDNYGSRYTGQNRAKLNWYRNGAFNFGDRMNLNAILTDESLWLGSLDYETPLNHSSLRGQIGYAYTAYELGKDYAPLGATGFAKVWSAKLNYHFTRSQHINLHLTAGYEHKDLNDHFSTAGVNQNKTSDSFPIILRFDHRDDFFSGGITYGMLSWTPGTLNLDNGLLINDQVTARTDGYFSKYNLDLVRIQSLSNNFSLYLRYSIQEANKNLDSSERMVLGGVDGVRAYPVGEGSGDTGWLGQAELRYDLNEYIPYIFYDGGYTKVNHTAWDANSNKSRSIGGAGFGVRYNQTDLNWMANLAIAWRTDGGAPQNDVGNGAYRIIFSASHLF